MNRDCWRFDKCSQTRNACRLLIVVILNSVLLFSLVAKVVAADTIPLQRLPQHEQPTTGKGSATIAEFAHLSFVLDRVPFQATFEMEAPRQVNPGETATVLVTLDVQPADLDNLQSPLIIEPTFKAALDGSEVTIDPVSHEQQVVRFGYPLQWRWQITPQHSGTIALQMELRAALGIESISIKRTMHQVLVPNLFSHRIEQWGRAFKNYWYWGVAIVILFAVLIWLTAQPEFTRAPVTVYAGVDRRSTGSDRRSGKDRRMAVEQEYLIQSRRNNSERRRGPVDRRRAA